MRLNFAHRLGALLALAIPVSLPAQTLDTTLIKAFRWRTVGPSIFEGRVSDIAGIPSPSKTFFVAAAAGGVFKTTNDGKTYRPVFENERVASMGSLAIAPSDTMQVWAGTGEQNSRNSIEPGGGIYKSTDGGMTWKLMGLEKTEHIGRIVVHPTNPNIVYVAALGAAWRSNPERGLYKTTDGGATWKIVKFVSDKAGFIDVALDPRNPDVVFASSYERVRGPYFLKSGGPGSALWKSTDGGNTWTEIKGNGFPETMKGRINIAISLSNPDIMYTNVEADSLPNPKPKPGAKKQKLGNGLYRSADGGKTWVKTSDQFNRPFYYNQVRVDPKNPDRVYFSSLFFSDDGGRHSRIAAEGVHIDHHAMWIDPNDPNRFVVGSDGGISVTHDRGGNYDFGAVLPIPQFYEVSYDFAVPYNICGGAQDNGTWCGPSRRRSGGIQINDWYGVGGGDGFYTAIDPTDPNIIYSESQGGAMGRVNKRTGERGFFQPPSWITRLLQLEDSIVVIRGDTLRPMTGEVQRRIDELRSMEKRDSVNYEYRFNWNTPFILSPFNPRVFYAGGNRVFKSTNRGEDLKPISPDLSKQQWDKIEFSVKKTGGITLDATGAETFGTVVTLAESYVRQGFLYAGTDDGNVWMSKSDGGQWEQIPPKKFHGLPDDQVYVSRIEPSQHDSLTFYVSFDNHRRGDFTPYLYMTTDGGKNFQSLAATLPRGGPDFVRVIREDPHNRNLLFVGTSVSVYVSVDRGKNWQKFASGLPTVPIHDLKIHPRDRELIAATHGRGFYIVDISPLEQMSPMVSRGDAYLFQPKPAFQYPSEMRYGEAMYGTGHQSWEAPSPQYGAEIVYEIGKATKDTVRVIVVNAKGDTLMNRVGQGTAGLHTVTWGMSEKGEMKPLSPAQRRDSVIAERRVNAIFDSLRTAGRISQTVADRYKKAIFKGDYSVLYSRGGEYTQVNAGPWNPRPGEGSWVGTPPDSVVKKNKPEAKPDTAKADSAAKPKEEPLPPMDSLFNNGMEGFGELLKVNKRDLLVSAIGLHNRGGGGGFEYGGKSVETGDYGVILTVAGRMVQRQSLRVTRVTSKDATPMNGFEGGEWRVVPASRQIPVRSVEKK
jgi:photosystem II stability/assembly factor-like uncharacterized protein